MKISNEFEDNTEAMISWKLRKYLGYQQIDERK